MSVNHRLVVCLLLLFGVTISTFLQNSLQIGIIAMTNKTTLALNNFTSDDCPNTPSTNSSQILIDDGGEFIWSPIIQGLLLGANAYGVVLTSFIGGKLAVTYGGKWIFGSCIFMESCFCMLTPLAAIIGYEYLFATRFMFGLAEGMVFPSAIVLMTRWVPTCDWTIFLSLLYTAIYLGNTLVSLMPGYFQIRDILGGWPATFYVSGSCGLLWFALWSYFSHSSPDKHPKITKKELKLIDYSKQINKQSPHLPWKSLLHSISFWSVIIQLFTGNWVSSVFNLSMPLYLETVQNFSLYEISRFMGMVYIGGIAGSLAGGFLSDLVRNHSKIEDTSSRKIFCTLACVVSAACIFGISAAGCEMDVVFLLMFLAQFVLTVNTGGTFVVLIDMAPEYIGILQGFISSFYRITDFLSPLLVGILINTNVSINKWSEVFIIAAGMGIFGFIVFVIFGSAEHKEWKLSNTLALTKTNETIENESLLDESNKSYYGATSKI